jgi:hypothetical protein
VNWRQRGAFMQEAVTVIPSCNGGVNVVVAWSLSYGRFKKNFLG